MKRFTAKVPILKIFLSIFIFFLFLEYTIHREFKIFRVVIDPGHGGINRSPSSEFGDKYDPVSGQYLGPYREGASWGSIHEHHIMYAISEKIITILQLASPEGDYHSFAAILKKYTDSPPQRIHIKSYLSRGPSLTNARFQKEPDLLIPYRLFDSPDKNGTMRHGRISKINSLQPHMVVSLHCANLQPREYSGINPVLAPSYNMLYNGLLYLQGRKKDRSFFSGKMADSWKNENAKKTRFKWFLSDVSLYFTGYPLDNSLQVRYDKFKGYYYNMTTWKYNDFYCWEEKAKKHPDHTRYSRSLKTFVPQGKYWERERSIFEKYKREGGPEGFGGDNAYASYELIRFMIYALNLNSFDHKKLKPGKPYVNVWAVPLQVNAINPYIELGYFRKKLDRKMMLHYQDEIAEGIAVGIYSLFTGVKIKKRRFNHNPKGKKIDLDKYTTKDTQNYFLDVLKERDNG